MIFKIAILQASTEYSNIEKEYEFISFQETVLKTSFLLDFLVAIIQGFACINAV